MGASFRNSGEILQLAGCDRLTISPQLLQELSETKGEVIRQLKTTADIQEKPSPLTESQFLWAHNQDAMAVEKLAEGIRNFAIDQNTLEEMIKSRL
jgi:transaldolase